MPEVAVFRVAIVLGGCSPRISRARAANFFNLQ